VGEALAARILHAEELWDHPAFFDYVDRWMTPDDEELLEKLIADTGTEWYGAAWARQGQAWDDFVNEMWATYRNNLPPARAAQ
jgi:hypothetical protein